MRSGEVFKATDLYSMHKHLVGSAQAAVKMDNWSNRAPCCTCKIFYENKLRHPDSTIFNEISMCIVFLLAAQYWCACSIEMTYETGIEAPWSTAFNSCAWKQWRGKKCSHTESSKTTSLACFSIRHVSPDYQKDVYTVCGFTHTRCALFKKWLKQINMTDILQRLFWS